MITMEPRGARGVGPLLTTSLAEQDLNTSLHMSAQSCGEVLVELLLLALVHRCQ